MRRSVVLMTLACAVPSMARADQTDQALPDLFAELRAPDGDAKATQLAIEDAWYAAPETGIGILFGRAIYAMNDGEHDLALVLASHVNGLAPSFAEGWVLTGHARAAAGDNAGAATAYREAVRLEPRHYVAIARLGDLAVEAGDKQAGLTRYREALTINPHMTAVRARADRLREETAAQEI